MLRRPHPNLIVVVKAIGGNLHRPLRPRARVNFSDRRQTTDADLTSTPAPTFTTRTETTTATTTRAVRVGAACQTRFV